MKSVISRLNNYIPEVMKDWKVPGLAIAIIKGNKIIFAGGFGYRDREKKIKVDTDTLFAIASCTKAFTTLGMGILVDDKKLDWDKPVRDYLPDFRLFDPVMTERMTPRDLVTHRSGLARYDLLWYKSPLKREELYQRLRYLEPSKDLRTTYQYNNLLYMTAGYLTEKITGMKWEEFIRKKILNPLKMDRTNFSIHDSKKDPNYAQPYQLKNKKVRKISLVDIDAMGPAGSINSSVNEMAKWVIFHLNKGKIGKKKLISKKQLDEMYLPQMHVSDPVEYKELLYRNYGLAWVIRPYRGKLMLNHSGSMDGFTALVSFLPYEKIGMVVLNNLDNSPLPYIVTYTAYDYLLGEKPADWNTRLKKESDKQKKKERDELHKRNRERKKKTHPTHPLKKYSGEYHHPGYGSMIIGLKNKKLFLEYNSIRYQMTHYHYDSFILKNPEFKQGFLSTFNLNPDKNIKSISIPIEPNAKPLVFERKPDK